MQNTLDSKPVIEVDGVKSAEITEITVDESGENYKVNDKLNFSDPTISSRVNEVLGKPIISVGTTNTVVNNLKFSVSAKRLLVYQLSLTDYLMVM